MKRGENPQRGQSYSSVPVLRIFVVVYLPNFEGFFSEMRKVLGLCLDSLGRSVDPAIGRVTLISNGCCAEAEALLLNRRSDLFDQVIVSNENRGKVDGLLSAASGALEDVVVFSDCDVLFSSGWVESVLKVFSVFPEAGWVSPIASPRRYKYETSTTMLGAFLNGELCVSDRMPSIDFERMTEGAASGEGQYRYRNGRVSVSRNGFDTGLAGGHQCIAYRRDMIKQLPDKPSRALLEPQADRDYFDHPPDLLGYWRLSTPRNMAYHMGNSLSAWMSELDVDALTIARPRLPLPKMRRSSVSLIPYWFRWKLGRLLAKRLERGFDRKSNTQTVSTEA